MKKIIILLLFLTIASIIPIQFVSAGPISPEQLQLIKSGINWFDLEERVPYRPAPSGGGGSPGGSVGNVDPIDWSDFDGAIRSRLTNSKNYAAVLKELLTAH